MITLNAGLPHITFACQRNAPQLGPRRCNEYLVETDSFSFRAAVSWYGSMDVEGAKRIGLGALGAADVFCAVVRFC